ncbi:MAG: imidazolonepropionase, partial [Bryobacteraceae bacterium]
MKGDIAVVNCGQVVTLAGPRRPRTGASMREIGVIEDGALLVQDGRVHEAGPRHEIEPMILPGTHVIDAGRRLVLPGFVDAHTHSVFAGTRAGEFEERVEGATYAEIAARGGGILSTVRRTREANEEELLVAARRYREWFLRGGTTTIEAKSGYGLAPESEYRI